MPITNRSASLTSFHERPNSQVSYFDAALPGTQPKFNWNVLDLAFKAAIALKCRIQPTFGFDRKHYFYGDQPTGYQITQHFTPYALEGSLELFLRDGVDKEVSVRIKQIQIEQDTGKSTYIDSTANIDLNRSNTCLIEMVTEPDIPSPEAAGIFVKKLQMLLKHLEICSGEFESGAMRVDVNVSVNGGQRCEIKNLSSISAVVHAIKAEFKRQVRDIEAGKTIEPETRGWDGKNTWKLRGKESAVDYRYMPDPEILPIHVSESVISYVNAKMGKLPDDIFLELLNAPFSVPLVDARTLMNTDGLTNYYLQVYEYFVSKNGKKAAAISNWIVHRLWGEMSSRDDSDNKFDPNLVPASIMGDIVLAVDQNKITNTSGTMILKHYIKNHHETQSVEEIIDKFELRKVESKTDEVTDAIKELCQQVCEENPDVVERIANGKKPKSIMFLVGQVMKQSQGRVDAGVIKTTLAELIGIPNNSK